MAIKDLKKLFLEGGAQKLIPNSSSFQDLSSEVESADYMLSFKKLKERLVPHVDFSKPENFAKFGSAKEYYNDAIKNIYDEYPYDGSLREKIDWELSSSFLENYIFENEYPRTTGFINFTGSTLVFSGDSSYGTETRRTYGRPTAGEKEYVLVTGSYKKNNVYDPANYRGEPLVVDLNRGSTVEFWLKKDAFLGSTVSRREVLFDLWNKESTSSSRYGRLRVELDNGGTIPNSGTTVTGSFRLTVVSGTAGVGYHAPVSIGSASFSTSSIADSKWHHYAFTFANYNSQIKLEAYKDGKYIQTIVTGSSIEPISSSIEHPSVATIGSLVAPTVPASAATLGDGKLSGSVDEFRLWKTARNAKEIGRNWFTQVGGGTNTDTSNVKLGLYYKFNEGIKSDETADALILDYSGRQTNGEYVGYSATSLVAQRETGSAMVLSGKTKEEFKDPIIFKSHPDVVSFEEEKKLIGIEYDQRNTSMLYHTFPSWVIEEDDDGPLKKLCQIVASYFDTLYLQIQELPKLKNIHYPSGSEKPYPFIREALENKGFVSADIFTDSELIEEYLNQSEDASFKEDLNVVRNRIYQNIYNNLEYIYKSKGTEKSINSLLRSMGLGDDLVKINYYGNNLEHVLRDNFKSVAQKKRFVNFQNNFTASIYQYDHGKHASSKSLYRQYLISSASWDTIPITLEANVVFPKVYPINNKNYNHYSSVTSSLFGAVPIATPAQNAGDSIAEINQWRSAQAHSSGSLRVYAVRNESNSKHAKFMLKIGQKYAEDHAREELTSSYFTDLYDDSHWNISVRVKPVNHNITMTLNSALDGASDPIKNHPYILEFYGVNTHMGEVTNEFYVTKTLDYAHGSSLLTEKYRKIYAGAERINFTGTLLNTSDVKLASLRYWYNYLDNEELQAHAKDIKNYGVKHPYRNFVSSLDAKSLRNYKSSTDDFVGTTKSILSGAYIPAIRTLAMHWDFENVTGSDESGKFYVADFSSGSTFYNASNHQTYKHHYELNSGFGSLVEWHHPGIGYGFGSNDNGAISEDYIHSAKQQLPEVLNSSDQIEIRNYDDDLFVRETRPVSYFAAIEKSPYQLVSDEMINMFATIVDFNNLIGNPVNKYRHEYKELDKLKALFFSRVQRDIDFDRFLEFYKWMDFTVNKMIENLIPASANVAKDIRTILESHVLERNKYQWRHPALLSSIPEIEGSVAPADDLKYYYYDPSVHNVTSTQKSHGSAELDWDKIAAGFDAKKNEIGSPLVENKGALNRIRRKINAKQMSSGDATIDKQRDNIRRVAFRNFLSGSRLSPVVHAGLDAVYYSSNNQHLNKKRNILVDLFPFKGTVESKSDYLEISSADIKEKIDIVAPFHIRKVLDTGKEHYTTKASVKRHNGSSYATEDAYSNKIEHLSPFTLVSHSAPNVKSEFHKSFKNRFELTNLHIDSYDLETPLQGPFTEKHVGGYSYRHVPINVSSSGKDLDTEDTRVEGWRIRFANKTVKVYGPGATGPHEPRSFILRDPPIKRPVSIKNIRTTQSALDNLVKYGNYQRNYEVVNIAGYDANNLWFVHHSGAIDTGNRQTDQIQGALDYTLEDRSKLNDNTRQRTVISERFSAPGGPEINSLGFLDTHSRQYSVYNNINYRNLSVRTPLRTLLSNHEDKNVLGGGPGYDSAYSGMTASYHGQFGNARRRIIYSDANSIHNISTSSFYNNAYVSSPIPGSDRQYSWITASLKNKEYGASAPLGYGPRMGLISSSQGYVSAFEIKPASDQVAFQINNNKWYVGADAVQNISNPNVIPVDYVHLNTHIYEPVSASENTLGYSSFYTSAWPVASSTTRPTHNYMNTEFIFGMSNINGGTHGEEYMLNALLLNRNGPYGYPMWKQLRTSEHPVATHMRKNNRIAIQGRPRRFLDVNGNEKIEQKSPKFSSYTEPVVTSKYKPLAHKFLSKPDDINNLEAERRKEGLSKKLNVKNKITAELTTLKHTYGNNLSTFSRKEIDNRLDVKLNNENLVYDDLVGMYLYDGLGESNPIDKFVSLKYEERIYPREQNEYLKRTFMRENYSVNFWRSSRPTRTIEPELNSLDDAPYVNLTSSMWPLDARTNFATGSVAALGEHNQPSRTSDGADAGNPQRGEGELQNAYSLYHNAKLNNYGGGVFYSRRALELIPGDAGLGGVGTEVFLVSGDTKWEAGEQAGKEPFPNGNYESWAEELRRIGKDHTIIPEFRISEHMDFYIKEKNYNFLSDNEGFLTLTGSAPSSSMDCDFSKTYLHTDFIKHFNIIEEHQKAPFDNGGKIQRVEPSSLTLKCGALMKFLPYDGFYPALRTLQLANLFSASYWPNATASMDLPVVMNVDLLRKTTAYRPLYQPFFAPGIMYNTIKAGIAVDYPILFDFHNHSRGVNVTGSRLMFPNTEDQYSFVYSQTGSLQYQPRIKDNFDFRIPFEALLDPSEVLLGYNLIDCEPHGSASVSLTASFGPPLDFRYKLAMNNFLAECQEMFVERTVVKSDFSDNDLRFGLMEENKPYRMSVGLRKTKENFVMYDRHSAFGPPVANSFVRTQGPANADLLTTYVPIQDSAGAARLLRIQGNPSGYAPFTPPYEDMDLASSPSKYTGSLAIIEFDPRKFDPTIESSRFDLSTIQSGSTVAYARNGLGINYKNFVSGITSSIDNAMQITASLNIFDNLAVYDNKIKSTNIGLVSDVPDLDRDKVGKKWVIDTKFETPMLNFTGAAITYPQYGKHNVSRGMWHQYGVLPENPNEGVVIEINDVPGFGSLADAVGLRKGMYRVGNVPKQKKIKEAIVAIPFREIDKKKYFFKIDRERTNTAIKYLSMPEENIEAKKDLLVRAGKDVVDMIQKMQNFVFPPKFDFLTYDGKGGNPDVTPVAMYIFEFEHTFDQQDLVDMWQNLAPDLAYKIKEPRETVASISHPLLNEAVKPPEGGDETEVDSRFKFVSLHKDLRWMVFKVKQKAAWNYYNVLKKSRGDINVDIHENDKFVSSDAAPGTKRAAQDFAAKEIQPLYNYNWPYDFFTMIELAKMDASITMTPSTLKETEEEIPNAARAIGNAVAKAAKLSTTDSGGDR